MQIHVWQPIESEGTSFNVTSQASMKIVGPMARRSCPARERCYRGALK